ncbi:MAG: 4Fe-4S ferredoxin [Desulfobacterium sp.]|nr:4Fe-4S ferredoxin [Desulfobacterium sp.]
MNDHPTVKWFNENTKTRSGKSDLLDIEYKIIKEMAMEAGADDCGITNILSPDLKNEKEDILALYPKTRALISLVIKLNRENVQCVSRSVSDLEFLQGFERNNSVGRKLVTLLKAYGVNTLQPSVAFPMDITKWPGKMWAIPHKTVAVAAGMGHLGHNRLIIHPDFGNFILLGTLLIDRNVTKYDSSLDYNPCIKCGLCISVCPVGAIAADGSFSFINCMVHNYRDRMGGFSDWVENIVKSTNVKNYRSRVNDTETVSMWQSLSYGICNKSSYCMAACPAGKDNIGQYLSDRKDYNERVVRPLQNNTETVFVLPDSDAVEYVRKKYPYKKVKIVGSGLRPATVAGFLDSLPLVFQKGKSKGVSATYHFTFTGEEHVEGTVDIRNMELEVKKGHIGQPDISIIADSKTWLGFLAKEKNLFHALLARKIKIKGSPLRMKEFAKCFPL